MRPSPPPPRTSTSARTSQTLLKRATGPCNAIPKTVSPYTELGERGEPEPRLNRTRNGVPKLRIGCVILEILVSCDQNFGTPCSLFIWSLKVPLNFSFNILAIPLKISMRFPVLPCVCLSSGNNAPRGGSIQSPIILSLKPKPPPPPPSEANTMGSEDGRRKEGRNAMDLPSTLSPLLLLRRAS